MTTPPSSDPDSPLVSDFARTVATGSSPTLQLGPYRLLQRIGEGGMGEVWLAEQSRPVHRHVAVKVIKAGMDTRQVIARFEAERQALALMDHPAIAKVFDGGETPEGRPYFAMEYVKGEPITTYCDRHRLSIRDRLLLFIEVCDAVQHAHQKGIIHRDLKPSNVLVTILDDSPMPKIIDFGVAKATAQPLTERSLFTEVGALIGTLEYMSPEQAEVSGLDIDTRTDVYALGAILYELLTGSLPFEGRMLREAALDEIRRVIREKDPPKPSTRVAQLGPAATESVRNRATEPSRLVNRLKGDLDWITMRALEKDRTRRYATANALAADVRRHLDHEPVTAGPPTAVYRARKFVRRHRVGVGAATAFVMVLVAFASLMAVQARRIARERDRANREAETARQVSSFLVGLFEVAKPSEAVANSVTVREILDRGADRVQQDLIGEPEVQATLISTMGDAYYSLGLYGKAELLDQEALRLQTQLRGERSVEAAESSARLARALERQARYPEAERMARDAVQRLRAVPGSHETPLAEALSALAWTLNSEGKADEALAAAREARSLPNVAEPERARSANALGVILFGKAEWTGAEQAFGETLDYYRRTAGPNNPRTITAEGNLAVIWTRQRKLAQAETAYREIVTRERQQLGPGHVDLAAWLNNLGAVLYLEQKYAEAETFYREALAINQHAYGDRHPSVALELRNIGQALSGQRKYDEAERVLRDALAMDRDALGDDHPRVGLSLSLLGDVLCRVEKSGEAERAARQALEINSTQLGNDHPTTKETQGVLGWALAKQHRFADAEPLLLSYAAALQNDPSVEGDPLEVMRRIVDMYTAWGRTEDAAEWRTKLEKKAAETSSTNSDGR